MIKPMTNKQRGALESALELNAVHQKNIPSYKYKLDIDKRLLNREELNSEDFQNILIQSFLSVGSFHNLTGYIHRDCKYENFLYQNNNAIPNGYYKYTLNDKNYYLKSCKYNVMIYDFGLSKNMLMSDEELVIEFDKEKSYRDEEDNYILYYVYLLLADYKRIFLNISYNKNIKETSKYLEYKNIIKGNGDEFWNKLENLLHTVYNNKDFSVEIRKYYLAKILLGEIIELCLYYFPDIFLTQEGYDILISGDTKAPILNEEKAFELYRNEKINTI
jgi:serine/threonine protein kinase